MHPLLTLIQSGSTNLPMQKSDFSYFYPLRVRYSEIDAQAVVYNSHYVTYYDLAITEFLRHLDVNYGIAQMEETGKDYHTVKVLVEYHAPALYDDELEIHIKVGRIGNSSITWQMAIFRKDEADVLSSGEVVWVYADMKEHKSSPLPADVRQILEKSQANA